MPLWLVFFTGCTYAKARLDDFGDIFRFEGHAGYGLQAHANVGELLHLGAGSSRQWSAGWIYGRAEQGTSTEDHLPLTIVYALIDPRQDQVHRIVLGRDGVEGTHRCYLLFPHALNPGTVEKADIHFLDIEVGFLAWVAGFEVGFSILELIDFVLGFLRFNESWTTFDPADDDPPPLREGKRLWTPKRKTDGVIPIRPN